MPATFRRGRPQDLDVVHELRRALNEEDGTPWTREPDRSALAALLAGSPRGVVWVAEDAAAVVGYVVLTFGYSLEYDGPDAFVDELYVRPTHRRRGVGGGALALAESACREHGARALHLEVDPGNAAARALYRAWGFVEHPRVLMTKRPAT